MNRAQLFRLIRGGGSAPAGEAPTPIEGEAPTLTAPDPPRVGDTYTGAHGGWNGSPTSYVYIFEKKPEVDGDWSEIEGEGGSSISMTGGIALVGQLVRFGERPSNPFGTAMAFVYSDAIGPILAASSGSGGTGGTDYPYAPVMSEKVRLWRTPLVSAGQEFIDFHRDIAHPASAAATTWNVGGSDLEHFDIVEGGLVWKAGATIPRDVTLNLTFSASNDHGMSHNSVEAEIFVPADANCRFCDFDGGSNANNGTTPALAWKQLPGTIGYSGPAVADMGGGVVVFFRGGVHHRYQLVKSLVGETVAPISHKGDSETNQFVMTGTGWGAAGERAAAMDGSDLLTGARAVTQAEINGNPQWENIVAFDLGTQGGAAGYHQMLNAGDVLIYPAQIPKPVNRQLFETPTDVTQSEGMRRLPVSTSGAVFPRMSRTSTTIEIVDDFLSTAIGDADPIGQVVNYWSSGNFIARGEITYYDQATHTLRATAPNGLNNATTGAYSLMFDPAFIVEAGQYGLSADRLTAYVWRPNTEAVGISRRDRGYQPNSYQVVTGLIGQGYSAPSTTTTNGGFVVHKSNFQVVGTDIERNILRWNRADGGAGVIYISGQGLKDCNIENNTFAENPKSSGIRCGAALLGVIDGTPEQVVAGTRNKIRGNFTDSYGIGQTLMLFMGSNGLHICGNVARNLITVHGNGISFYVNNPAKGYATNINNVVENNFFDNVMRCMTTSIPVADTIYPHHNVIRRNIFLAANNGYLSLYSGGPDDLYPENIIMGGVSFTGAAAMSINLGNRITVTRCVIGGFALSSDPLSSQAYTVTDNLMTVSVLPANDGPTRVVSGNTVASEASTPIWDKVMTAEMAAKLGPGRIGLFWDIAA